MPPPSLPLLALELRAPWEFAAVLPAWPVLQRAPLGDGHTVIVFPGLTAGDTTTLPLRRYLESRNYNTLGWGQGLNLGLADAQTLARVLHGRDYWRSVADMRLLRSYERERKAAMLPMSLATDGLQQLFSRTENPLQTLRNWGMRGFERNGLLKNWIVRQAMGTH
jgi:hypothetical protein